MSNKEASQDVDSSLLYFCTEPLEEPALVSSHVPSPPVHHVHTDKSISIVPMGLLRYHTLSDCCLPSSKELPGLPAQLALVWVR